MHQINILWWGGLTKNDLNQWPLCYSSPSDTCETVFFPHSVTSCYTEGRSRGNRICNSEFHILMTTQFCFFLKLCVRACVWLSYAQQPHPCHSKITHSIVPRPKQNSTAATKLFWQDHNVCFIITFSTLLRDKVDLRDLSKLVWAGGLFISSVTWQFHSWPYRMTQFWNRGFSNLGHWMQQVTRRQKMGQKEMGEPCRYYVECE